MHEQVGAGVEREAGNHGAHDCQIVHTLGDVGEEFADPGTGLAVLREGPRALEPLAVGLFFRTDLIEAVEGFAVEGSEFWFGIEGVDVGDAAGHKTENDVFDFGREVKRGGGFRHERSEGDETETV